MDLFTEEEILNQLITLGFSNVSPEELIDIKNRINKAVCKDIREASNSESPSEDIWKHAKQPESPDDNYFKGHRKGIKYSSNSSLYSGSTVSSGPRTTSRTSSVSSKRIKKRKVLRVVNGQHVVFDETDSIPSDHIITYDAANCDYDQGTLYGQKQNRLRRSVSFSNLTDATKSFLRPKLPHPAASRRAGKTDPVALYHAYKGEWDKHKAPGETQRKALRWNVRAQMVNFDDFALPLSS